MGKETVIRDFSGYVIGYIEEAPNGDKIVRDFYRIIKGKYIKRQNVTKDFYGRIVAKGDATSMLLNMK